MPNSTEEDMQYVHEFSESLSGQPMNSFSYIFGERELIVEDYIVPLNVHQLSLLELNKEVIDEETVRNNIELFAKKIFGEDIDKDNSRKWLYDKHNG